jgi:hypothetical protein
LKEIELTNGKIALVSDEDYEKVNIINWYYRKEGYAVGNLKSPSKGIYPKILLHRYIMNAQKGVQIDHINGNKLDNRRENLRVANASLNKANCGLRSNNKSGYKGVQYRKDRNKCWFASIKVNYKLISLGYYYTPEEAARAYNEGAIKYFGEFSKLNELKGDYHGN